MTATTPRNLLDKIWHQHTVDTDADGTSLLYIDRHIVHEVTSAQAFEGLRIAGRKPWRNDSILATPDHQVPTTDRDKGAEGFTDPLALLQVTTLEDNCDEFGIRIFKLGDQRQGIVHVVGPEQGATLPGMTLVCGDSHTSTHGAFAALAQGVGTSEVEHVLATQCLKQCKPKSMRIDIDGRLGTGVTAKDLILYVIGQIGGAGANGYVIEYCGEAIRTLSMEGRMTVCNMSIEAGARAGMVAFDAITEEFLRGRTYAPKAAQWEQAINYWKTLHSDIGAEFDATHRFDARDISPHVSWGTKPEQVIPITAKVPQPQQQKDPVKRGDYEKALQYMDLKAGTKATDIAIDKVFIGSCTNGRIEDIRAVASHVKGKRVASRISQAMVVPGSGLVKQQAEAEGLDKILLAAGFEWRDAGCSMCNAMNPDRLLPGERCASTSNRNFESRQGYRGRTHLLSPVMAAAAAIAGHLVDIREVS